MAQAFAIKFYNSRLWRKVRANYIAHVFGLCELCGKPGKIVHHKIPLTESNINNLQIALGFDNLQLLCYDCHRKLHEDALPTVSGLRFDSNGDLIQGPPKIFKIF